MKIGELFVEIGAKLDNFNRGMSDIDRALQRVGQKFTSIGKRLTLGLTLPLVAAGGAAIKMAMDAVESENLFEVSMKGMANSARRWSEKLRNELGLNSYEVRRNIATFNVMLDSMGLTEQAAYDMAKGLTQLTYDMASFYNLKPEEAFLKLQSGISGEIEPLKRLGILVNENTIKHWALTNGLIKQGQQLTEQQKVQARYNVILEQTTAAQGDLARTIDSPTNKLRILKSRMEELGIEIGTKLLPLFEKILKAVDKAVTWFSNLSENTKTLGLKFAALAAAIGPAFLVLGKFMETVAVLNAAGAAGSVIKLAGALGILAGAFYLVKKRVDENREANRQLQKHYDDRWQKTQKVMRGTLDLAAADEGLVKILDELKEKNKLNNEQLTEFILSGKAGEDITRRFSKALNTATEEYIKQEEEAKKAKDITSDLTDEMKNLANEIYQNINVALNEFDGGINEIVGSIWEEAIPAYRDMGKALDEIGWKAQQAGREIDDAMRKVGIPAARDMSAVLDALGYEAEIVGEKIKSEFQIASERMKDAWAREIGEMISEFKSFKDFFNDILSEMWRIFADMIGKMIVKWATDFLQNTLISKTKSAASTVTGALTGGGTGGGGGLGGLLSSGGGGLGGLWTGVGAAAGTLLAGLITGGGVSKRTGQDQLHEARLTNILLYQTQQHELHWINDNLNLMYTQFTEQLIKSDAIITVLRKIRHCLDGSISAQGGFHGTLARDTIFRAHAGEEINIQPPSVNIAPQPIHNHFYVDSKEVLNKITWASKYGQFKIHERASKRF